MKVTAQGKTFNFPDGTPQEDISAAVDEYFAGQTSAPQGEQGGLQSVLGGMTNMIQQGIQGLDQRMAAAQVPAKQPMIQIPDIKMPYGMTEADIIRANVRRADMNRLKESIISDPYALTAYKQAAEEDPLTAMAKSAASEGQALASGIAELEDKYLPAGMANLLQWDIGGDPEKRREQRAIEMAKENLIQGARQVASPASSTVGSALPYIATEIVTSPVTGAILNNTGRGIRVAGKQALRGLEKAELGLKAGTSELSQQGAKLIEPVVTSAKNIAARPVQSPETLAAAKELVRAPLTGYIEGAASYNMTPEQGALNSLIGQALSLTPIKSALGRTPVKLSQSEKDVLKGAMREGYIATPGMRTGSKVLQAKEQGFRSEARFRDYMNEVDTANRQVIANYASDAMGLPRQGVSDFTPEMLTNHMADLSSQYKALEANTVGKFSQDSFKRIGSVLKNLQPTANRNQSAAARQRYAIMNDAVNEMRTVLQPFTTREGKFARQEFSGANYQAASQYLNDQISSAYQNGDKILGRSLKSVKEELDKSIESGMGTADAKQWRDLNERYAMTRLVAENGMDPLGGIDTNRLTSHLMSGDEALRTLTSKGNRIKKLQDIAKIDTMQRRQAGAEGWSGSGVETGDTRRKGLLQSTVSTPFITRIPGSTRAGMGLYMSGIPSVTGLTGLSQPAISKYFRAQEQGSGTVGNLAEQALEGAQNTKTAYDNPMATLLGK